MNSIKYIAAILFFFVTAICYPVLAKETFKGIPDFGGNFKEYSTRTGEDIYPIARNHGYAIEHVQAANGLTGLSSPGGKLIIPTRRIPPVAGFKTGLVLNLPEKGIYLFKNGRFVKFYPVAIGQGGRFATPTGDMKIVNMTTNPTWFPPEWAGIEEPVPAGPDNPLGDRWMGLDRPGFGIHATNNPSSIGMAASHGCIRMYPEMARDLYEQVYVGMPVKVVYEPVKLGYDPEKKQFFLEIYPDVYGMTPGLFSEAKTLLENAGLMGLIDENTLKQVVDRKRGIPEVILGSDVVVKIDGKKKSLAFPPLKYNNKIWVSSEVLDSIDATLVYKKDEKIIEVHRDGKKAILRIRDSLGSVENSAYVWQGKSFIPLSYVLKQIGVRYSWYNKEEVVYISTEHAQVATKNKPKPPVVPTPATPSATPAPTPSPTPTATVEPPVTSPSPEVTPSPSPSPLEAPVAPSSPAPETSPSPGQ